MSIATETNTEALALSDSETADMRAALDAANLALGLLAPLADRSDMAEALLGNAILDLENARATAIELLAKRKHLH